MSADIPLLTKSDYVAGLHCAKKLYLKKFEPALAAQPDSGSADRMAAGVQVGALARLLFPGGIMIEGYPPESVAATRVAMETAHTLFEASFVSGGRLAKVDVLQRAGDGWRVLEVKATKAPDEDKAPKPEHLEDLAFQVLVLREAGVNVTSAGLILLNRAYVAPESGLNVQALFEIVDVTEEIQKKLVDAQFRSIAMLQVLSREEPPEVETNTHCAGCCFYATCHREQGMDDLVFLPRLKAEQVTALRKQGVRSIADIPDSFKLQPGQARVREAWRTGKPFVGERLSAALQAIRHPVYFLDFEAASWAVPPISGTAPYEPVPFQWSCHVLETADAEVAHREFLHRDSKDPRDAFAHSLWEAIGGAGSILVYSSYEITRLRSLAAAGFPYAREMCEKLEDLGVDLLKIVQEHVYLKEFRGSYSIKAVLPVMAPGHGYSDLAIRDGSMAASEYKRMVAETTSSAVAGEIAANLLAYCRRDTEAMVELYAALWKLSRGEPISPQQEVKPGPDDSVHHQLTLGI